LTDTIDYRTIGFSHNRPNPDMYCSWAGYLYTICRYVSELLSSASVVIVVVVVVAVEVVLVVVVTNVVLLCVLHMFQCLYLIVYSITKEHNVHVNTGNDSSVSVYTNILRLHLIYLYTSKYYICHSFHFGLTD